MDEGLSQEELGAAYCWETVDRVPGRPTMTDFRRRLRLHAARWRESNGHPIGTQPIVPRKGKPSRLVGSHLPLDYGRETGANFLTSAALDAARARTSVTEPHQSFDHQRLWADLLWSPSMAFNLFGDLAADLGRADRAVHAWWPDTPGTVSDVLFAHSPGWLDPSYLGNLMAWDVAFVLDLGHGTQGIIGLDIKYHDATKRAESKPERLARYVKVAKKSGIFGSGFTKAVNPTDLLVTWLEHLLVHSMLQHPSGAWSWGRYLVVYPSGNTDFAEAYARYRELLMDESTFSSLTLEELLGADALPKRTTSALRARYVPR
ncbi:MAG: hypothetical protein M3P11_04290 [Actinomycetota bacterium]|nr:hypothetical protein [Actinomycetota bacterium]